MIIENSMADRLSNAEINEHLQKGYFHIRSTITIMGKPKEHVEETLLKYTEKLFEDPGVVGIQVDIFEGEKPENSDLFQCFVEFEALFESLNRVTDYIMNYLPGTVEFIAPSTINMSSENLSKLYSDFTLKMHRVDAMMKKTIIENHKLKEQLKESSK